MVQIMVATGSICMFHVGGCREKALCGSSEDSVPRWEFFMGDRPHAPAVDAHGKHQPMVQLAAADCIVQSGSLCSKLCGAASIAGSTSGMSSACDVFSRARSAVCIAVQVMCC
jgi:hypothetical protein